MITYFMLFFIFAKIGGLTFGGGYAMLPMLQHEIVHKHGFATEKEITDYYAISQCTPGIIAINIATFIGYKKAGILGGIIATLGITFPSVVIITLIASFLQNFTDYSIINHAFNGIQICVCILIFESVRNLWKKTVINTITFIIFSFVFISSVLLNISPVVLIIISGIAGIIFKKFEKLEEN